MAPVKGSEGGARASGPTTERIGARALPAALGLLAALAAALGALRLPPRPPSERRLIQFGWGAPTTTFLRRHIREMERMPFDGVVLDVRYQDEQGRDAALAWSVFGKRAISWEALLPAQRDLEVTVPRRLRDNFVRFNVTPGDVDWWDEAFDAVVHNARITGRLVRRGRLRGVLLDVEQYQRPVFSYADLERSGQVSEQAYAAQVRRRGRQVMEAFQAEAPGLVVFLTFGYSLAASHPEGYGLLRPFLDGLFEAAEGATRIVDGCEFAYPYRRVAEFEWARWVVREAGRKRSAVPEAYTRHLLAGFGIWMDYDHRRRGWSVAEPSRNYFTPQALESALAAALRRSDRYVWLYGETPRWWTGEALPEAYVRAVWRARARAGLPGR